MLWSPYLSNTVLMLMALSRAVGKCRNLSRTWGSSKAFTNLYRFLHAVLVDIPQAYPFTRKKWPPAITSRPEQTICLGSQPRFLLMSKNGWTKLVNCSQFTLLNLYLALNCVSHSLFAVTYGTPSILWGVMSVPKWLQIYLSRCSTYLR